MKSGLHGRTAIDIGCGFGRHSVYLAQKGFDVTAIDVDGGCIDRFQHYLAERPHLSARASRIDAYCSPQKWQSFFDLGVIVDFVRIDIVTAALRLVKPGGYLIYQSVGNRGGNWILLPRRGEVRDAILRFASLTTYEERRAGPNEADSVTVRFVAQRHDPAQACNPQ